MDIVKIILWSIGLPLLGIGLLLIPLLLFRRFYASKLNIPEGTLEKLGIEKSLLDELNGGLFFVWYFGFTFLNMMNQRMPFDSILRWSVNIIVAGVILFYIFWRFLLYFNAWKKTPRENTDLRKVLFYYSIGCAISVFATVLMFAFFSFLNFHL
jgi:hypothetical protein